MKDRIQTQQIIGERTGPVAGRSHRNVWLRKAPFTARERDILTGLAGEVLQEVRFPAWQQICPVEDDDLGFPVTIYHCLSACTCSIVELSLSLLSAEINTYRRAQIESGIRILLVELQRQLGAIFPLEHPFWSVFYHVTAPLRIEHWNAETLKSIPDESEAIALVRSGLGIYLLPLEVLSCILPNQDQLQSEMLRQSLISVLSAYLLHGVGAGISKVRSQLAQAAKLSARLNRVFYEQWLAETSQGLLKSNKL